MKLLVTAIIFMLATPKTFGQKYYNDTASVPGLLSVSFSPLSLISSFDGSGYRAGLQVKLFKNIFIGFDGKNYYKNDGPMHDMKGHNIKARLVKEFRKMPNMAFGIEYCLKVFEYSYEDSITINGGYKTIALVNKNIQSLNITYSYYQPLWRRFFLDFHISLGAVERKIKNSLTSEEELEAEYYWDSLTWAFLNNSTNKIIPNLSLGIRLGFKAIK